MRIQPAKQVFASILSERQGNSIVINYRRAKFAQRVFDSLVKEMNLPNATISPGAKGDFVLHVCSAAKATLLRHQLTRIQAAMQGKMGPLTLRVRNRPPLAQLGKAQPPLIVPKKHLSRLRFVAEHLTHPQLKRSVQKLIRFASS